MKGWHLLLAFAVAYALGAMFPGPFSFVKLKVGL